MHADVFVLSVCVWACTFVCVCVCVYVCVCVRACVRVCVRVRACRAVPCCASYLLVLDLQGGQASLELSETQRELRLDLGLGGDLVHLQTNENQGHAHPR